LEQFVVQFVACGVLYIYIYINSKLNPKN